MLNFSGKVALVTGADEPIGAATAELLARGGAALCRVHGGGPLLAAPASLVELGAARVLDFGPSAGGGMENPTQVVSRTVTETGRIDLLVNAAHAVRVRGGLEETTESGWQQQMESSLTVPFQFLRAAARVMLRQRSGSIVNVTSVFAEVGAEDLLAYSAAKAGLIGLTKSAARELAGRGIRVNLVSPGALSDGAPLAMGVDALNEQIKNRTPLGRLAQPRDVAQCVVWLASDEASYLCGELIRVNGGWHM